MSNVNCEYHHLNVKHEHEWIELTDKLKEKFGYIDDLDNNTGITGFLEMKGLFDAENVDLNSWNEVHNVNATGLC